ncbi:purpurin-like [Argopecten irradians]|uniref:purpurin-like n=1 Tax=Argopecten irradians TaxID=31199 RepID=UPI00371640FF
MDPPLKVSHCVVLLLGLICFTEVTVGQGNQKCYVNEFEMEPNFTMSEFQGEWYVISIRNRMTAQNGGTNLGSSMRQRYTMGAYGSLSLETNLQNAMFGCMRFDSTATPDPYSNMTKFTIISNNAALRRRVFGNTIWIVRTDHRSFAVVYSCGYIRPDGTCEEPTVFTLNRNWNGHTPNELVHINEALASICVHPSTLIPVSQDGDCALNDAPGFTRPTQLNNPMNQMNPTNNNNMPGWMNIARQWINTFG